MPSSDREVFESLVGDGGQDITIKHLTYALFAFERREWIAHWTSSHGGTPPSQDEIDAWINNITQYQFANMQAQAAANFDASARQYLAQDMQAVADRALQDALLDEVRAATEAQTAGLRSTLAEVKAAGSFWRQAAIALITAILAPIIIGGILAFALVGERAMPTIAGVRDAVMPKPGPKQEPAPGAEAPR